MNAISSILKFIGNQMKNSSDPVLKSWLGQTVPSGAYKTMTSYNVPAGARVVILARTGNGEASARSNACNFFVSSGAYKKYYNGASVNNSGGGNPAIGWCYVEAQTNCVVDIRQYGYGGEISGTASGDAICIPLRGGASRSIFKLFRPFTLGKGVA